MGKILDQPQFPVVDASPSVGKTVANFSINDWAIFGGLAAISYPLGWAAGAQPSPMYAKISGNMARPSAVMAALMGAAAGFMLAYQNSSGRLMGFKPNEAEVVAARR